jgi:hypothetical protein
MHMDINHHVFSSCFPTVYMPCLFQMGKTPHLPNQHLPRKVSTNTHTDGGNLP